MTDKVITEAWNDTKSALLEGLEGQKRQTMDAVLENTQSYLAEAATAGATGAGNVAALNKVILPVIRRVMPTVIANELVGVQPMTGPVGQIHTLRVRYADAFDDVTAVLSEILVTFIKTSFPANSLTLNAFPFPSFPNAIP